MGLRPGFQKEWEERKAESSMWACGLTMEDQIMFESREQDEEKRKQVKEQEREGSGSIRKAWGKNKALDKQSQSAEKKGTVGGGQRRKRELTEPKVDVEHFSREKCMARCRLLQDVGCGVGLIVPGKWKDLEWCSKVMSAKLRMNNYRVAIRAGACRGGVGRVPQY